MDLRPLGRSGLSVSPLCFGGNVFGWTADEGTSFALLDRFVEAGFNFVDTADVYSRWVPGHRGGESEAVIGRWLKARPGHRDRIVLATKVGMDMGEGRKGLAPDSIAGAVEDSLRRLQTDRIDLYQSHTDDPETPIEETLRAYERLIRDGKVRAIGASNYAAARLREALDVAARAGLPRYECLQPEYSLAERGAYEAELEPLCRQEGLGVISYFSLAAGFLTGKYREAGAAAGRAREARVAPYLNPRGFAFLEELDAVAAEHGATPAQVALAWLIARPGLTAPIASATSVGQLDELIAGARLALAPAALARLEAASRGSLRS
ncbi:1-deoxyxylulose-5-phosphate synthase YajO [Methylobacterium crusticola]|uniref:1-deoxyxylulose-5-phosphate synthase YajO n=1 Tax=Methylobacterium crusticola TaxID=1697972 RepID=A0ABQ4R9J5_9HYPH|nr:aldo/keto reductase [Methylobacterium crusticola]GJD53392.1 1-deoxyxylulose-5-phosphate synthase YajO [Methylobacterium crusticola]